MRKLYLIITLLLLILFFLLRLQVRSINHFSNDELNEIKSLSSLQSLVKDYLPHISGGSPGHYILLLAIKKIFPNNNLILNLPGFLTNTLVFLLIPWVLKTLNIIEKKDIPLAATIARIFFVFDPKLTYQAMEIRPYADLPILWIISLFLVSKIRSLDKKERRVKYSTIKFISFILLFMLFYTYHYYSIIMILSIYAFYLLRDKIYSLQKLFKLRSFQIIIFSALLEIPLWIYFTAYAVLKYKLNTLSYLPVTLKEIYAIDKGFPKGIIWQNWIYFLILVYIGIICFLLITLPFRKNKLFQNTKMHIKNYKLMLSLVIFPLTFQFLLTVLTRYLLSYRQFAWIMIPLYTTIGVITVDLLKKNKLKSI